MSDYMSDTLYRLAALEDAKVDGRRTASAVAEARHAAIEGDLADYRKRGGTVRVIPPGVSGQHDYAFGDFSVKHGRRLRRKPA